MPRSRSSKFGNDAKDTAQLASQLAEISTQIAEGNGVLVFDTLNSLKASLPNGVGQPVWIISEKAWYYWDGSLAVDTTPPTVTASPNGGTYGSVQNVTLTASETATIYYTVDGTTPTTSSNVYNGSPISLATSTTLKFFAKDNQGNASAVQTVNYTITVVTATYFIKPTATKTTSGSVGWKGSMFTTKQALQLQEIAVNGGTASGWELWTVEGTSTKTLGTKVANGTYSGTDSEGYTNNVLATPISLLSNQSYVLSSNYTASGASGAKLTTNTADTTDDAYIKADVLAVFGSTPANGQTVGSAFAYDVKLKVVAG